MKRTSSRAGLVIGAVVGLVACAKYSRSPESAMMGAAAPSAEAVASPAGGNADGDGATWKRSSVVANKARLKVGDHEELPVASMSTKVTIDGFRARVVIDYTFDNTLDRQLEGTFQMRLPEEASPYFFAFGEARFEVENPMKVAYSGTEPEQILSDRRETWSGVREAQMVPRDEAAIAYGETVRVRVDPALVEWAGAGVFNANVFPLAPHKHHRIVVAYDVNLVPAGDKLEYRFDAPDNVHGGSLDVRVDGARKVTTDPPTMEPKTRVAPEMTSPAAGGIYHFEELSGGSVAIRLDGAVPTLAGTDPDIGDVFAASVAPKLPVIASTSSKRAVFAVDTSLSSNPDRFNIWLQLMQGVLDANRDSLDEFAVLFFSVDAHWYKPMFVPNTPGNVAELMAYANSLALAGATDLAAGLGEAAHPGWSKATGGASPYDVFLLSDGASTWGEANLHAITNRFGSDHPLFAYQTGLAGTEMGTLAHLARESGGAVFSVTGASEIPKAAVAHRARAYQLVDAAVRTTDGTASDVLLAGRPKAVFPGQRLQVVGRGKLGPTSTLALTVLRDGKPVVLETPLGTPLASPLARRAYGQIATDQLEELDTATTPTSRAYALHFRVTGKTCSLLVLESDAAYRQHHPVDRREVQRRVQTELAAEIVAKTYASIRTTLGDPRAMFGEVLAALEHIKSLDTHVPNAYRDALAHMPDASFDVPSEALATTRYNRDELSPMLATHELDYDKISMVASRLPPADALKALSSLVEENPGDAILARDVGFSAMELGLRHQAYQLFRRVVTARPYEPQTYRAIAQALARMGKADLAMAYYEIPLMATWDGRFGDMKAIVELDYLRFLRAAVRDNSISVPGYARARLDELAKKIALPRADLVTTIMWNTDNSDVDLHVVEPSGEECFYGHRETKSGGTLTRDVTQGYGPEMYVLPNAPRGRYNILAHYFASNRNRASARTKVYVTVIEDWGTPKERVTERVIPLEYGKETHDIASLVRTSAAIAR